MRYSHIFESRLGFTTIGNCTSSDPTLIGLSKDFTFVKTVEFPNWWDKLKRSIGL
jgi:hypothetical protein